MLQTPQRKEFLSLLCSLSSSWFSLHLMASFLERTTYHMCNQKLANQGLRASFRFVVELTNRRERILHIRGKTSDTLSEDIV